MFTEQVLHITGENGDKIKNSILNYEFKFHNKHFLHLTLNSSCVVEKKNT